MLLHLNIYVRWTGVQHRYINVHTYINMLVHTYIYIHSHTYKYVCCVVLTSL